MPAPVLYTTVAFSIRNLKLTTRDRLHALAALREARLGTRVTLEEITNAALERGCDALEAEAYGPKLAAKLAHAKSLDSGQADMGDSTP